MIALAGVAFSRTTYAGLVLGLLLITICYSFGAAAFQALLALIGQQAQMSGRLSTLQKADIAAPRQFRNNLLQKVGIRIGLGKCLHITWISSR